MSQSIQSIADATQAESHSGSKTVLVCFEQRLRPVLFVGGKTELIDVVRSTFKDILNPQSQLILQIEDRSS